MRKQMDNEEVLSTVLRELKKLVMRNYEVGAKSSDELTIPVLLHGNRRRSSSELQALPDYLEYMRLIDEAIEREDLSTDDRVIARAFAIAVYRRALANRLMSDVKILAAEAIGAVMQRLGKQEGRNVKQLTYRYGSTRREQVSRRQRSEQEKRAGEAG
jgi:hypothetical protein